MNLDSKYYDEFYNYVTKGIKPNSKSKKAVFSIVNDIIDRGGIGGAFVNIDGEIQDEIIDSWIAIIDSTMA